MAPHSKLHICEPQFTQFSVGGSEHCPPHSTILRISEKWFTLNIALPQWCLEFFSWSRGVGAADYMFTSPTTQIQIKI